jgi:hypothetical protein
MLTRSDSFATLPFYGGGEDYSKRPHPGVVS